MSLDALPRESRERASRPPDRRSDRQDGTPQAPSMPDARRRISPGHETGLDNDTLQAPAAFPRDRFGPVEQPLADLLDEWAVQVHVVGIVVVGVLLGGVADGRDEGPPGPSL